MNIYGTAYLVFGFQAVCHCTQENAYYGKRVSKRAMRMKFFAASLVVILAMYLVPFTLLSGVEGPYTALFWAALSAAYLALVWLEQRRD
ncbi:MAG: hypothetical protein Metus_1004 [Candidatus Methanosuratincola subterraneus]|jgi:hypothetical protein|uniref:Uncharacterized protein n=1 Tax=Methanosuratincola subterraneus TaxID=2593994 RepID=A0A3S3SR93_METS7|nr:MAG: hypothetical protein Metus_1004 [Candidatus Methanosuratincola subterraneus]